MNEQDREFLGKCSELAVSVIRSRLEDHKELYSVGRISEIARLAVDTDCDTLVNEGCARILVSLMPASFEEVVKLLSVKAPRGVFDTHFIVFASLERSDFNGLEQDGIELMLVSYLQTVESSAGFAAWKAGLVLGSEWLSEHSLRWLIWLLSSARHSAGRLGALNGYVWALQHKECISRRDLRPIVRASREDSSLKVRSVASHALKHWVGIAGHQSLVGVEK